MRCLILVDLQYDFMPGGALAVTDGDQLVAVANRLMPHFDLVIATQDWHPAGHMSFASSHEGRGVGDLIQLDGLDQVLWPDHCVQRSRGAKFHHDLNIERIGHIVQKGTAPRVDSYSGFFDNGHRTATELADLLKQSGITEIAVMGLATDYCVKFTAIDATQLGLRTSLIKDGCRGVDLTSGDIDRAIIEMVAAGVQMVDAEQLINKTIRNQ
jgi:nicotinamidase/pyrazinamidase